MAKMFLDEILSALSVTGQSACGSEISVSGEGELKSWFSVTDLATASIGAAGAMLARWVDPANPEVVAIDRRLASLWFDMTLRPEGWQIPSPWDPIAGDYRTKDGWIRLHTNAPHHRAAALAVLGNCDDRSDIALKVTSWNADDLEGAVVEAGGCAAAMRGLDAWAIHPQGRAVSREPLIHWHEHQPVQPRSGVNDPSRPLRGIRILDLTRVLAGPVAGRFLAAYGADMLRIDPPDWDEPGVVPEVTLGKRCAMLDLTTRDDRAVFEGLLETADVVLHGYRADALAGLGYGPGQLRAINPGVIDVSLNAYGWTGPWVNRRGFDSLVQMSSGIAEFGMRMSGADRPQPLPVQALDHATGYLLAAAVLHALNERAIGGRIVSARLSLARVAHMLSASKRPEISGGLAPETPADLDPQVEDTHWGPARRIRFPMTLAAVTHAWDHPAGPLRASPATWS
ncbi:MAG: CoA transferase [Alphaproteobacteria bacterium]|nr:CoA transferase [Alphaproteobacteria bacterium]